MSDEAPTADWYETKLWQKDYPEIQIVTIAGLLDGAETIDAPAAAKSLRHGRPRD